MDPGSRKENASKKEFPAAEITEDGFLGGQLRLRQPKGGHRAGHDAILLAAATPARSGDRVVDLGAGVGAAGLAVARRVRGIDLVLVEIDPAMAELARNNAGANAIMAEVVILDVEADAPAFAAAGLAPDSADVVLMNPPFSAAVHVDRQMREAALRHIGSALARLPEGGRLVTITGANVAPDNPAWTCSFKRLQEQGRVVFSAAIDGAVYAKHGTNVEDRKSVV